MGDFWELLKVHDFHEISQCSPDENASHPFPLYHRECPKFINSILYYDDFDVLSMVTTSLPNSERSLVHQPAIFENVEECCVSTLFNQETVDLQHQI